MTRNLEQLFEEFVIYDAECDDSVSSYIDAGDNAFLVTPNNGNEDQYTFDLDAPVTYTEEGFSCTDRTGAVFHFTAFIMRRVHFDTKGNADW